MPGISVRLPLKQDEVDGLYGTNATLVDVTKQDLKMLFLTIPGERIMLPNYGVGLRKWLFENIDDRETVQADIIANATEQIQRWMPYIQLNLIDFRYSEQDNPHLLGMSVFYTNIPLAVDDILEILPS